MLQTQNAYLSGLIMLIILFFSCTAQDPISPLISEEQESRTAPVQRENQDTEALKKEAISLIKRFGGQLKPRLKAAMQEGGAEKAIEICAEQAPAIAAALSAETGWDISRVSLKNRSPHNAPDAWEKNVLQSWDMEVERGVDANTLVRQQLDMDQFRFMKAQKTEALCLGCHGETIVPQVKRKLGETYPDDLATGYTLGQVRGAFSVSRKLN